MLSRVLRFFTESWGLKLAALGLAVLLWMTVTASEPERARFGDVPIQVDLRDPDWRLARPPQPPNVSITVQGPRSQLVELSNAPFAIRIRVDRVNDSMESHVIPLQSVQQQIPAPLRDIGVLALRPDTITLHYERLGSRSLPVRVRTRGDLPRGYALSLPINTNPSTVEVRGPRAVLEQLDSVPLFPVELNGLRSTTNVPVSVDTTRLPGLSFDPREVNVVLRVVPADSQPPLNGDTSRAGAPF